MEKHEILEPQQLSAAAGISASTLYRLMASRTDKKKGKDWRKRREGPRLRTKRRLATALRVSMAELFQEEQLEILDGPVPLERLLPHEELVLDQLDLIEADTRTFAARSAVMAWSEVLMAVACPIPESYLGHLKTRISKKRFKVIQRAIMRKLPDAAKRDGARRAILAMLDLQAVGNVRPTPMLYGPAQRSRWSEDRIRKNCRALNDR